ncbi:hypothetical protein CANCADRAFT_27589 [Tortispora caseinolytica NRRL Y-17796]|uniref:Uncharacterized protein n=1 Tax=Tortispora caseinolytica NRRL Y-17796 TaxID=767744 RepID=A0A1E4TAA7_9ASCO|nr:hypothetical protein CANCADRAFT_27589 [Tortispora caseinolytica NRRL Y-17796]
MAPPRKTQTRAAKESRLARTENGMKLTAFPQAALINQKNYSTEYIKKDEQQLLFRQVAEDLAILKQDEETSKAAAKPSSTEASDDEDASDIDNDIADDYKEDTRLHYQRHPPDRIIAIQLGSHNLRVGRVSESAPHVVPNVIARKMPPPSHPTDTPATLVANLSPPADEFMAATKIVVKDFRDRMRYYKRRIQPGSRTTCLTYNSRCLDPEIIKEHDDINGPEWTDYKSLGSPEYLVGDQALNLPNESPYVCRWPISHGFFNERDYFSQQEILGDISTIISEALNSELGISKKDLDHRAGNGSYSAVLIIPDLLEKSLVENLIDILFRLGFLQVSIIQEALAATYGAGLSTACVVDLGAQTTKVSCVEDGMIIPDSRINIKVGGDDIALAFQKLLLHIGFPYLDIDLRKLYHWHIIEELKRLYITFNDADITPQVYNFFVRQPGEDTKKYSFKLCDEAMLAPLGIFYPELYEYADKWKSHNTLFAHTRDIYTGKISDHISEAMMTVYGNGYCKAQSEELDDEDSVHKRINPHVTPVAALDHSIIESISVSSKGDSAKAKRLYDSIILVGGGSNIANLSGILEDRIQMWSGSGTTVTIIPPPRDMEPEIVSWKGACVFSRLNICREMWISHSDWAILGARCLPQRCLFYY